MIKEKRSVGSNPYFRLSRILAVKIALIALMVMALLVYAAGFGFAQLANSPWPMRGRDTRHTGQSPYKNESSELKWKYATGRVAYSSPAIGTDGTVYVGTGDTCISAINADGSLKWRYVTGGYVYSSPAIGADGTVYVGGS